MHSFLRKIYTLVGVVVFFTAMPAFVFAQEVGGVYQVLGVPTASGGLLAIRILQIVWFLVAMAGFGFAGYGFYLLRRFSEDLYRADTGGKYMRYGLLVGGISLVLGIILTIIFSIMSGRTTNTPIATPATNNPVTSVSFAGSMLGSLSRIVSHYPARDDKNIPRNASLLITFSDTVSAKSVISDSGSLLTDVITLKQVSGDDKPIEAKAELDVSKKILKIVPNALLGDSSRTTPYQVSVSPKLTF